MDKPLIAIPVKPFGVAKRRLAGVLDAAERSRLGREVASRTIAAAQRTGAHVAVVTADRGVAAWARSQGTSVIVDPGSGLDNAALAAVEAAHGVPWVIVHADLPLVAPADMVTALDALETDGSVIAPSYNGGTSVLGGRGAFTFRYGPGSFHRHLAQAPQMTVLTTIGLAIDLDAPSDLEAAKRHALGSWLSEFA
jgi:2-phospho-L-lactate guanylyltransferase